MAFEEKRAWIMVVVTVAAYLTYLLVVLGRAGGAPLPSVPYAAVLLWTIGGAIAASILLNIAVSLLWPQDANKKDARDREIGQFGEYIGQSFLVIGGVAALGMAMAKVEHFWIANGVYLAFVLSSLLGSTAKLVAYRRGLPQW